MDRLTFWDDFNEPCFRIGDTTYRNEISRRLAAYEDTGYSPEEVRALKATLDKVKEEAMPLLKARAQGRLAVLPAPVGSFVYTLFCGEVVEKRIGKFLVNGYTSPQLWVELDCDFLSSQTERWDLAEGKTVFLTREEAEAALKERQHD